MLFHNGSLTLWDPPALSNPFFLKKKKKIKKINCLSLTHSLSLSLSLSIYLSPGPGPAQLKSTQLSSCGGDLSKISSVRREGGWATSML